MRRSNNPTRMKKALKVLMQNLVAEEAKVIMRRTESRTTPEEEAEDIPKVIPTRRERTMIMLSHKLNLRLTNLTKKAVDTTKVETGQTSMRSILPSHMVAVRKLTTIREMKASTINMEEEGIKTMSTLMLKKDTRGKLRTNPWLLKRVVRARL